MKRMIYQVYTGKRSYLYDHCVKSVEEYCKQHGIDHEVQRMPILRIKPDVFSTNRSKESYEKHGGFLPIYEKENAFSYWPKYDQIAVVDADIWIRPGAPNIFDDLDPKVDFAGVVENSMPILPWYKQKILNYSRMQYASLKIDWNPAPDRETGFPFMNMGLMVMNKSLAKYLNGETPNQFIRRAEFKAFVDGMGAWKWSTDQTLLNYWIRKERMKLQFLDWKWNALYTAIDNNKIKEANFVHFFLKDKLPNRGENVKELMELVT
ncbi:hypothetical protein OAA57_00475 [bacterium]|jgi:hypothetical protein|nr:hypothetical protein [bacterium]MDB4350037.1 hypothetical protein [bacterium]